MKGKQSVIMLAAASMFSMVATAGEVESSLARGGQLYDMWFKVVKAGTPKEPNPAYPEDRKYYGNKGSDWRCKECHGWDYMGVDGAYSKGKHFTGTKGISGAAGTDNASIIAILKNDTHGMAGRMDEQDFVDLANFVSRGQINMDNYIDRKTKGIIGGNSDKGAAYYNTICANCHGVSGDLPNDMKKTFGKQMSNPWEVMHKILNAQPAEKMPALRALDPQVILDIMAHLKTLPTSR